MVVPELDKLITFEELREKLGRHGVANASDCGYEGSDRFWAIDVKSSLSTPIASLSVRVGVFKTREDGSVFDVKLTRGPFYDLAYVSGSGALRRALEAEQIPFQDDRNAKSLANSALDYALKLYDATLHF